MEVLVGLNLNLLTVTDYVIAAKNVFLINLDNTEYIASNWLTLVDNGSVKTVGLVNVILLNTEISDKVSLSFNTSKHDLVA